MNDLFVIAQRKSSINSEIRNYCLSYSLLGDEIMFWEQKLEYTKHLPRKKKKKVRKQSVEHLRYLYFKRKYLILL